MCKTEVIVVNRGFYKVRGRAIVRAVNNSTRAPLTKWKEYKIVSHVNVGMANHRDMIAHVVESDMKYVFSKEFVNRIRSHLPLKQRIGKTIWDAEIKDLVFKLDKTEIIEW